MNKALLFALLLQLAGVVAIIAEFILPTAGLLAVAAVGAILYSLYTVFTDVSRSAFMVVAGLDMVMIPVLILVGIKILARSPLALHRSLGSAQGVAAQSELLQELVNRTGTTITPLRPAGKAQIDGKRYDVVSAGDFIERDCPIVVKEVNGNRILVKKSEQNQPSIT